MCDVFRGICNQFVDFFLKNTEKNKVYSYLIKEMPIITLDDRL
jgi:hypothetical protein